jgi:hypothetical protein
VALLNWPLGTESIHIAKRLSQHLSIEEKDSVQCLILSAGRDIAVTGQVSEELFQLLFAGKTFGHAQQCLHVAAKPESVAVFGGKRFVLSPDHLAHAADCL